jgi:hypothetical protein
MSSRRQTTTISKGTSIDPNGGAGRGGGGTPIAFDESALEEVSCPNENIEPADVGEVVDDVDPSGTPPIELFALAAESVLELDGVPKAGLVFEFLRANSAARLDSSGGGAPALSLAAGSV